LPTQEISQAAKSVLLVTKIVLERGDGGTGDVSSNVFEPAPGHHWDIGLHEGVEGGESSVPVFLHERIVVVSVVFEARFIDPLEDSSIAGATRGRRERC